MDGTLASMSPVAAEARLIELVAHNKHLDVRMLLPDVLRSLGDLIFVTAGYGVIDLKRGELRYAQAGHPPPSW